MKHGWPTGNAVQTYERAQRRIAGCILTVVRIATYDIYNPLTSRFERLPVVMCASTPSQRTRR